MTPSRSDAAPAQAAAGGFRFKVHFNTGGVTIVVTITITTTAEKICGSTTRSPFTIS